MKVFLKQILDTNTSNLLSSRTYVNGFYHKCLYCNKIIDADKGYDFKGHWVTPRHCNCEEALKELKSKKVLLDKID